MSCFQRKLFGVLSKYEFESPETCWLKISTADRGPGGQALSLFFIHSSVLGRLCFSRKLIKGQVDVLQSHLQLMLKV